ncbi:MAG TPA: DoxX family protein [Steroidobacteraceae bacterium]|nr:DoxX family protein [Steroidobacteraceae bacterium]
MQALGESKARAATRRWTSRVLSGIAALFFLVDSAIHIGMPTQVVEAFQQLGYPLGTSRAIGAAELIAAVLYLVPRTTIFGAILLTGVLGGAIAAHMRIGDALFPTYIFPVLVGLILWGGPYLRDPALAALIPMRRIRRDVL